MHLLRRIIAINILIFTVFNLSAQLNLIRNDNIIVQNSNGITLKNPWAGGFNSVQFSEIDLNLDGIQDLFIFDRSGSRVSTFINSGIPNTVDYQHAPSYIQNFPKNFRNWVLLRDYNCDGKMDIFTSSNSGITVYKNTSTTNLSFVLETSILLSDFNPDSITNATNPSGGPLFFQLNVIYTDIPVIDDIDGDGDLDILTMNSIYPYVNYHKNLSQEKYGSCDSLDFQLRNRCWGKFAENGIGSSVRLADPTCPSINIINPEKIQGGNKHLGTTLLTLDIDANNTKDLILGDSPYTNFNLLINSDQSLDLTSSSITSQDTTFPSNHSNTITTNIEGSTPAGFYLDVNNDNIKDLIASPNCSSGCKNSNNVWFYENNNANNNPDFNLITQGFLQEDMIEVGEEAFPVFFDYDADGLVDILVGNHSEFDLSNPNGSTSTLFLYKNIGTVSTPAYQLVTNDYSGISTINLNLISNTPAKRLIPTFGDLDGDGDQDMIIGDANGKIHLFTNSAGTGAPASFSLTTPEYASIDVGNSAAPQLIDLNRDSLLDLVIGKENGFFSYFENKGNATIPFFSNIAETDSLGLVSTKGIPEYTVKNSAPFIYDDNGSYKMFSGSISGWIYHFGNIDGNLTGTFTILDSTFLNINDGQRSFVNLTDVTNDGKLDMLLGNNAGGIAFYQADYTSSVQEDSEYINDLFIYPNPAKENVTINIGNNSMENASIEVVNLLGKTISSKRVMQQKNTINLNQLNNGIYLIRFSNSIGAKVIKIVKY